MYSALEAILYTFRFLRGTSIYHHHAFSRISARNPTIARTAAIRLPAQHIPELLHVPSGGDVPAEIFFHVPLLQGAEGFPVVIVQAEAALQRSEEVVGVVALEGEAQTALAVFVGRRTTGTVP